MLLAYSFGVKARFSYPLVFLLPSAMAALIATVLAVGAGGGILWLFVYGDNPWPQSADNVLMAVAIAACLAIFAALSFASYSFGKKRESHGGLKWSHVALAAGISVLLPALAFLHQLGVGNIGPRPDSVLCSEFCLTRNYRSSMIPHDGTCRCHGMDGREALNVSMESVRAEQLQ